MNIVDAVIYVAGANVVVILVYAYFQFYLGILDMHSGMLFRIFWIPILAASIVILSFNMHSIASILKVDDPSLFSYDYAIKRMEFTLDQIKTFFYNYITAVTATLFKEAKRDYFDFYWIQYKRCLDDAKTNLDAVEKFRQVYYLTRALNVDEDAKRVLFDMMNRFRERDKKKYEKIVNEMYY